MHPLFRRGRPLNPGSWPATSRQGRTLDPGGRAKATRKDQLRKGPAYKPSGRTLDPGQRIEATAFAKLQAQPRIDKSWASGYRRPWGALMPHAQNAPRSAGNANIPMGGPHTLDPGMRARREAATTRHSTPPVPMQDPLAMSKLYNSKDLDHYGNELMKHFGV